MKSWLNIKDAATYAGVHRDTMTRWLNNGLKHSRVGRIIRIHPDNIDEYIQQYENQDEIDGIVKKALAGIA